MTLGAAAYGEFEIRRKCSRYYNLPEISPTGILSRGEQKCDEKFETKEESQIESTYFDKSIWVFAWPWIFLSSLLSKLKCLLSSKMFLSFVINSTFLAINLTHLFYLGVLFSEPDMKMIKCIQHMASFDFISTKLAFITFLLGYFCWAALFLPDYTYTLEISCSFSRRYIIF